MALQHLEAPASTARSPPTYPLDIATSAEKTWLAPRRLGLLVVIGCFAVSRVAFSAAGAGFDASAIHPSRARDVQWQLLPLDLLRHHLLSSVWNLHSQPPLYNLACGVLLHLPPDLQAAAAAAAFAGLGAVMVSSTYLLLVELGVRLWVAVAVAVAVVADPSVAVYERWLSWSYPTAAALTAGTYFLVRFARTRSTRWAALSATAFATVVLVDSTFQWPWLLLAAGAIAAAGRSHWRAALRGAAVPFLLVAGWCIKDAAQFGTATTSSWLGMNLWQSTIGSAPPSQVTALIHRGALDPLAAVRPFQSVAAYKRWSGRPAATGVPALDRRSSELGVPNFNNSAYIRISDLYLSDDLSYVRSRPGQYGRAVAVALELWSVPAEQYVWPEHDGAALAGYARVFDRVVLLQRGFAGAAVVRAEFADVGPPARQLSWTVVVVGLVDLLAAPFAIVRRRHDRAWLATGTLMWATVAYSVAVTSLTEMGENMRFRFELGTGPVVLAVVTVSVLLARPGGCGQDTVKARVAASSGTSSPGAAVRRASPK